jgi:hypothetical protein
MYRTLMGLILFAVTAAPTMASPHTEQFHYTLIASIKL